MKRVDLIRHLESHDCRLLREGGNHSVYVNPQVKRTSSVPRADQLSKLGVSRHRSDAGLLEKTISCGTGTVPANLLQCEILIGPTSVPRHREINDYLARKICRDLEIPEP